MKRPLTVEERVTKARVDLLRQHYFYGALAMRLELIEDPSCETAATNGSVLRYNPEWIASKSDPHIRAIVAHEVMHCAGKDVYRFGNRDSKRWNVACDYRINLQLVDAGFSLPDDALLDEQYRHPQTGDPLPPEIIYARLGSDQDGDLPDHTGMGEMEPAPQEGDQSPQEGDQDGQEPGAGPGDDGDENGDQEAPGDAEGDDDEESGEGMSESDWDIETIAVESVCERRGRMPGGAARAMAEARKTRNSWREAVIEFLTRTKPAGYTWQRPNRRYVHQGMTLPGRRRESFPAFAIVVDTSGSVSQEDLDVFGAAIQEFASEVRPQYVKVIYCDAEVQGTETFGPDEPIELHACGGGGTAFQPGLDAVAEAIEEGENLTACLYITDLYGPYPVEPDFPVLWVISPQSHVTEGPFGKSVRLDPDE